MVARARALRRRHAEEKKKLLVVAAWAVVPYCRYCAAAAGCTSAIRTVHSRTTGRGRPAAGRAAAAARPIIEEVDDFLLLTSKYDGMHGDTSNDDERLY